MFAYLFPIFLDTSLKSFWNATSVNIFGSYFSWVLYNKPSHFLLICFRAPSLWNIYSKREKIKEFVIGEIWIWNLALSLLSYNTLRKALTRVLPPLCKMVTIPVFPSEGECEGNSSSCVYHISTMPDIAYVLSIWWSLIHSWLEWWLKYSKSIWHRHM